MFKDKKVLIRVEYNVPLDKNGKIRDNSRIKSSLPTIKSILKQEPKQVVLMTHLGRPKNKDKNLRTNELAKELTKLLKKKVKKVDHCGEKPLPKDEIIMLENLRFYEGEKKQDRSFAKQLGKLAEYYVNESFGTCHRKDSSMYLVPKYFSKKNRFAGIQVKKEIEKLNCVLEADSLTIIVGFAKIKDKIKILKGLLEKCDKALIGGAVAFSFMKALGQEVGKSLALNPEIALKIYKKFSEKIILPIDFRGRHDGKIKIYDYKSMPKDFVGLDIGPDSEGIFEDELENAKTIFWNGPLGKFEEKPFDTSTNELAKYLGKKDSKTIIGGGDTVAAIKKSRQSSKFYHISTGGGAALEYIEKGRLPALKGINLQNSWK